MNGFFSIAIDGPAGAGKSTIAKKVSKDLGFVYVDTGAMYRAMGYYCVSNNIDTNNEEEVYANLDKMDVSIKYIDGEQAVFLNGENVNAFIRTPQIGEAASSVSVHKEVRAKLVALQQKLALKENVVMDGRDISLAVLPNAEVKVYLDADVKVRAKRRYDELVAKGEKCDLTEIEKDVAERDYRDMHRDNSPLVRVPEATYIDSSYMTIDEVAGKIEELYFEVKGK
ncbi:MAG: (d)CMP kinase [Lachnospiraceae bacterium]|nr:(d)CMP kinase [Lachnospiraceae bacterium]